MPAEEFRRAAVVTAPVAETWATITDVPRLVDWVGIVEQASIVEPLARYTAVLSDRVGMFSLRADLDIVVDGYEDGSWIKLSADGEDRQVGSRIVVHGQLRIEAAEHGTRVEAAGRYEVTGRVATLGSATIRRKAKHVIDEFFGRLEADLG